MSTTTPCLYVKHRSGATHAYSGRRAQKLRAELEAGRGSPQITALVEAGYTWFIGPDGEEWGFEGLLPEHF